MAVLVVGDHDGQAASSPLVDRGVAQAVLWVAAVYCIVLCGVEQASRNLARLISLVGKTVNRRWRIGQKRGMHVFPMLSQGECEAWKLSWSPSREVRAI